MITSIQSSVSVVLVMVCVLVAGNYLLNLKQGMRSGENVRETKMWGIGFVVYALLDYLILQF